MPFLTEVARQEDQFTSHFVTSFALFIQTSSTPDWVFSLDNSPGIYMIPFFIKGLAGAVNSRWYPRWIEYCSFAKLQFQVKKLIATLMLKT